MKRLLTLLFCFLLFSSVALPAAAASNSDAVLASLRSGVVVNGKTVEIPANYINQAENYFVSHQITDAQASYILAEVNAAKAAIQAAGITSLSHMDANTKRKIIVAAQSAANKVDLKLSVGADKDVKITDSNGAIAFSGGNTIKTTGLQLNWAVCLLSVGSFFTAVFSLVGFLICKYKLLENKDE